MHIDDWIAIRRLRSYYAEHYPNATSDEAFLAWLAVSLFRYSGDDAVAPKPDPNAAPPQL